MQRSAHDKERCVITSTALRSWRGSAVGHRNPREPMFFIYSPTIIHTSDTKQVDEIDMSGRTVEDPSFGAPTLLASSLLAPTPTSPSALPSASREASATTAATPTASVVSHIVNTTDSAGISTQLQPSAPAVKPDHWSRDNGQPQLIASADRPIADGVGSDGREAGLSWAERLRHMVGASVVERLERLDAAARAGSSALLAGTPPYIGVHDKVPESRMRAPSTANGGVCKENHPAFAAERRDGRIVMAGNADSQEQAGMKQVPAEDAAATKAATVAGSAIVEPAASDTSSLMRRKDAGFGPESSGVVNDVRIFMGSTNDKSARAQVHRTVQEAFPFVKVGLWICAHSISVPLWPAGRR